MNTSHDYRKLYFSPEYGGDAVTGGGHPADSVVPAQEEIDDTFGQDAGGRGKTPGVGVPGSKNNPVGLSHEEISRRAHQIWEQEDRPNGQADEHWRRAEEELRARES
jgi:hypothetical protein